MKKIVSIFCLLLCAVSFAHEENETNHYETEYQQEETNDSESVFPPITVNISVSNANDAHSSSKTDICQDQSVKKKELEKKKEEQKRALEYARSITVIMSYLAKLRF